MGDFFSNFVASNIWTLKWFYLTVHSFAIFQANNLIRALILFYTNYSRALLMQIQDGYKFQSHDHSLLLILSVILPHCALVFSETHLPSFNADNLIGALIPLLQTTSTVPMLSSRYIQMRYWPLKLSDRRQMPLLILTT